MKPLSLLSLVSMSFCVDAQTNYKAIYRHEVAHNLNKVYNTVPDSYLNKTIAITSGKQDTDRHIKRMADELTKILLSQQEIVIWANDTCTIYEWAEIDGTLKSKKVESNQLFTAVGSGHAVNVVHYRDYMMSVIYENEGVKEEYSV